MLRDEGSFIKISTGISFRRFTGWEDGTADSVDSCKDWALCRKAIRSFNDRIGASIRSDEPKEDELPPNEFAVLVLVVFAVGRTTVVVSNEDKVKLVFAAVSDTDGMLSAIVDFGAVGLPVLTVGFDEDDWDTTRCCTLLLLFRFILLGPIPADKEELFLVVVVWFTSNSAMENAFDKVLFTVEFALVVVFIRKP